MHTMIINNGYEALACGLLSAFFAQVIKFSAGVMGLSTSVGIIAGFSSLLFAIAFGYALIVMYDAAGLRRAAGKTAACLNRMMDDFYKHDLQAAGGKLKELLGHTPLEVFFGAVFGILFAFAFHNFLVP